MIKLSIIIPMYNVEQYIGKCIESCLNQDFPKNEYEIVIVDDGSTDKSSSIVEEYQKKSKNIRLVRRENGGQGAARNTGLTVARGEYVWFVDSDDWIEPNCLRQIIGKAYDDNLDVVCFNLQLVFDNGKIKPHIIAHPGGYVVYEGNDFICLVNMPAAPVCAFYRINFLRDHGIVFIEGVLHEDEEFTPKAYCLASRIAFMDIPVYNYYQRIGSTMKSRQDARRCKDFLSICDSLYTFTRNCVRQQRAIDCMMGKIAFCFSQSLRFYNKEVFSLSTYKKKPYYPIKVRSDIPFKQRLKYRFINYSIPLYLKILKYSK